VPITAEAILQPKPSVTPETFEHPTAELEEFFFEAADGTLLNAWYLTRPNAEATVLFFGGYGFYLVQSTDYLDAFLKHNVNVMLWDYRGYGRSEGEPTVETMKSDALRAYEVLLSRPGVSPETTILHGHSLGTFVASYLADEREIGGLVLESPITEPEDWTRTAVPWYLRLLLRFNIGQDVAKEDNRERLRRVDVPLLLLAGGKDIVAPAALAESLHEVSASEAKRLTVIEEGNHPDLMTFPVYHEGYEWLLTRLFEVRGSGQ
jgi:pimeloyl-ACP methyl ester carboxylesterase